MPRYFFDVADGDHHTRDEEGLELPDRETARREAIASLFDIARDELPDSDHRSFVIMVRAAGETSVLSARLALDAEWLGPAG